MSPGVDRSLAKRQRGIGNDQVGIKFEDGTQSVALLAGPVRGVEAEHPGRELFKVGLGMLGTGVSGAEDHIHPPCEMPLRLRLGRAGLGTLRLVSDRDQPARQPQRRLNAVGKPDANGVLEHQSVHDHLYGMLLVLVQFRQVLQVVNLAVDPHADEPLPLHMPQDLLMLAFLAANDRR